MRRRFLLFLALVAVPFPSLAQPGAGGLIGSWLARVNDPVQGSAILQLVLNNDGSYQRFYAPEGYPGTVREAGAWSWQPGGQLRLRWNRYEVTPAPAAAPPQEGTIIVTVEILGPNVFRLRDPGCQQDGCWATLRRMD